MQEKKMRHKIAGMENAGKENAGKDCNLVPHFLFPHFPLLRSCAGSLKMREMENLRHENAAQERRGGK